MKDLSVFFPYIFKVKKKKKQNQKNNKKASLKFEKCEHSEQNSTYSHFYG